MIETTFLPDALDEWRRADVLRVFTIHAKTPEFPKSLVLTCDLIEPGGVKRAPGFMVAGSLEKVRGMIQVLSPGAVLFPRSDDDEEHILESWA